MPCQASAGQAALATHSPIRGAWQRENRPQLGTVVTEVDEPGPGLRPLPHERELLGSHGERLWAIKLSDAKLETAKPQLAFHLTGTL